MYVRAHVHRGDETNWLFWCDLSFAAQNAGPGAGMIAQDGTGVLSLDTSRQAHFVTPHHARDPVK